MGSRGRGGGRGRGRGGYGPYVKPEPFILYPDVELPPVSLVPEQRALVAWGMRLQNYWKSSPYYIEEATATNTKDSEIERYSDGGKPTSQARREPLSYHLKLTPSNFPQELIQGSKRVQHDQRRVRWNPESGFQKLDILEKLELKHGDKDEKEKKEGEDEEEEEGGEAEEEGISDDDDYNQNIDFDDDEDDFNMDEGEDEAIM